MKTFLGALGTTLAAAWDKTPAYLRFPLATLTVVFLVSETNIDLQHSLQAARIFGGQAAQSGAQADDANQARKDLHAGLPITGAAALLATQINQGDATARNTYATVPATQATSDAASESIEEIQEKVRRHQFVNTTERLRLLEFQTKEAERDRALAEAQVASARASSAASEARASIAGNDFAAGLLSPNGARSAGMGVPLDMGSLLNMGRQASRR